MASSSDPSEPSFPAHLQEAISYFQEHQLTRFLQLAYQRYRRTGALQGTLRIEHITEQERLELATLLQRPPTLSSVLRVPLALIDQTLQQSRFHCNLQDIVQAFFSDQPALPNKEQRLLQESNTAQFHATLHHLAQGFPASTPGHRWLLFRHNWLVSRYKRFTYQSPHQHAPIFQMLRLIATALNQLPIQQGIHLAVFAEQLNGDPHTFDLDREEGRLFLKALEDLFHDFTPQAPKDVLSTRIRARALYEFVGLFHDMISSTVTLYGLNGALFRNGMPDPYVALASDRIHRFPLCQVREWQQMQSPCAHLYLIENPPVFETLVARLRSDGQQPPPTLICTWGWPSIATRAALDLFLAHRPDYSFYYSGDFDAKGLQIASWLQQKYPNQIKLWRIDAESYRGALQHGGRPASSRALETVAKLPGSFHDVIQAIQATRTWSYQEGIIHLLAKDIMETSSR
jgi:uncharacterized protein (TIGR02679 family)